jgi:hypothetical protein
LDQSNDTAVKAYINKNQERRRKEAMGRNKKIMQFMTCLFLTSLILLFS